MGVLPQITAMALATATAMAKRPARAAPCTRYGGRCGCFIPRMPGAVWRYSCYSHGPCVLMAAPLPCLLQLGVELMHRDARWHCERSYTETFADGRVQLFFIDTNPFIAMYRDTDWARYDGGILQQSWEVQLREIERRLADSRAQWKLLVGHHPPRSNGHHGNNSELMEALEPLMAKYNVQVSDRGAGVVLCMCLADC